MKEMIKNIISAACNKLYEKDKYLIINENSDRNHVSERSIVFRFGIYLQELMNENNVLKNYNLDCEYNRNIDDCKRLPDFQEGIYPDLIIHQRGSNKRNLIIIECKTWWNDNLENDLQKIENFIAINGEYRYKYGISIVFEKNKVRIIIKEFDYNNDEFIIEV